MAFAVAADVATRLGRSLSLAEEAMVDMVLVQIEEMITEVDGRLTADIDPVPAYYRALCIEKTLAVGSNPNQLASESEMLGAYQHSKTYRGSRSGGGQSGSDLFLTENEERMVRRIANNSLARSTRPRALPHDVFITEEA